MTGRRPPLATMLDILHDEDVHTVFGNPGTSELPFLHGLVGDPRFEFVLALHEASAVAMADGYARATGRPAFVSLHIAAGLANGLIGLLNASRSRTPLVVTAGQQDSRHLVQDPLLSGDLIGLAGAAVKQTFDVRRAADLPILLRRAFAAARRPPAGPVFLSVPMDLLADEIPIDSVGPSSVSPPGAPEDLASAVRLLAEARNPVIVAGDGVGRAGAVADLVAVAEALGAVVYHQPMHDGIDFPQRHPLHAGMLPPINAAIRAALDAHDAVLIAGCHAFSPHHYSPGPALPAGIAVVQLDSDAEEIGRNFPADAGLVGGIRPTLRALADRLAGRVSEAPVRTRAAARRHNAARADIDARARLKYGSVPLHPLAAVHAVTAALPDEAVVVEEAITAGVLLRQVLRQDQPRSLVHTVGGGLGSGIGAAIGTRLGDPSRPVVAVLGDGCTLFGLQGLWSAARYQVPVTFVVMNNGEYRTLKETLDTWHGRTGLRPVLDLSPPQLDFTAAAAFFGIESVRVTDTGQLTETIAKAVRSERPLLVDVPITGHNDEEPL
ncbi:thiamine pyrophosphate-binding protein [Kutzneria sp. CA-103260]|uniref:thiamine pyrophosphate-binding protein n=1 Tax=Kutzneria sp. CA-103260 TaxID=2802641 RepID=UPI001BAA18A5|nr:thiamine pyrophosphate-binding protein [Kutzneria sp. CA-103260]QUQ65306.1 benzoylformate decarboxylase [Kutzneria sp. CA-103260]